MNKSLMLLIFFAFLEHASAQDLWTQRDSLNGPPRANSAAFSVNGDGYVVSGFDGFNKKRSMVSYDPIQDDWDNEESLGGDTGDGLNRQSAMSFQAWSNGFVCMGEGEGFVFSDLWQYDPFTKTWTQKANFPGTPRTQGVAFDVDQIGYIGLGKANDFSTFLNDFWSYDFLTNIWTQVADFPGTARIDAVGSRMGGKAYVGLGRDDTSFPNDFYEYYPADDTWQQKADFPGTPRMNATSFASFPQMFVMTGDDGFSYLKDNWEYNYFGDAWSQRTDFPGAARSGCISLIIDNKYFVGTGFGDGTYYDDFYEYVFTIGVNDPIHVNFSIYPNPSQGPVNIVFENLPTDKSVRIFNELGQEVYSHDSSISTSLLQLDLASFENGIYYICVSAADLLHKIQPIVISK